jgi:hypothetical protein
MGIKWEHHGNIMGYISLQLPSGKQPHSELERSTIFNGKIHYKPPFSIAM